MKIVIIEDSELICAQLLRVFASEPRIEVVAVASEEETAVQVILDTRPDAVLLDLSLAPGSGLNVLKRIRAANCGARVLVLTNNVDSVLRTACLVMGAAGFFDKTQELDQCLAQLVDWLPPKPEGTASHFQFLDTTGLLDAAQNEAFANIAQLAREIASVPMAAISLINQNRQWFLASQGLPVTPMTDPLAFCEETLLTAEMLEVEDTHNDLRFESHPLVRGSPNIRFYAGVPLILPSGETMGTLCVLDEIPRQMSATQKRSLKTLAQSAMNEIELRRRLVTLELEVGRRQTAEAHILQLAMRDPLTGLPNRTALNERLQQQLKLAQRNGTQLALLFIDMDGFKSINDSRGHDMGDTALLEVARRLSSVVRESDTVARLGGDEFVVVLPNIGDASNALKIGQKLVDAMKAPITLLGQPAQLRLSVGVALSLPDSDSIIDLTRRADTAMYQAKEAGGARACLFSASMNARTEALAAMEDDLRQALQGNALTVHFQPQVLLTQNVLCGVEALARWPHPRLGLIPPNEFIPMAERCGLIHLVGRQVLDKSLAQLAALDAQGMHLRRMSVNVSATELRAGFAELVEAALARHQIAPHRLDLEITESTLVNDGASTIDVLTSLRTLGVTISVDDFGVGYSSLSQLRRLPIDSLKIDRSFVAEICSNAQDRAIVTAIVTMARSLDLRTVAEGAESKDQLAMLKALGCDCVQGYIIAHPMPSEEFNAWVEDFQVTARGYV
jgi:diguanylate cyclase